MGELKLHAAQSSFSPSFKQGIRMVNSMWGDIGLPGAKFKALAANRATRKTVACAPFLLDNRTAFLCLAFMPTTCLLCGAGSCQTIDSLTRQQLEALWKDLGYDFHEHLIRCLRSGDVVACHQCSQCGFEFFDPSTVGDSEFYGALFAKAPANYYAPMRPEHTWALRIMKGSPGARVLDVGCGDGAFLERAKAAGFSAQGMEFSKDAAASARKRGFDVSEKPDADWRMEDFGGLLDWVTLFQVLEHVPYPLAMVRAGSSLLRPGGSIIIAVPVEGSLSQKLAPREPHRWPPHHLTRWTKQSFDTLAKSAGLELQAVVLSTLEAGTASYYGQLGEREKQILDPAARPRSPLHHLAQKAFWKLVSLDYCLPIPLGHSVFAHLRKPLP
jgi:2-polyprenyl-3-methyl-5-hydroxy-6-metoxy-1,4-benzoquinol methylase